MFRVLPILAILICAPAWAGDPTRPALGIAASAQRAEPDGDAKPLKLQQIVRRDNKVSVVINGKLYHPGDKLAGYTLRKVKHNHVLLRDGQQKPLRLYLAKAVKGGIVNKTEE